MTKQNFINNELVDEFPPEATSKIPDEELTKRDVHRDPSSEPGANKRAGVASRNPEDFDVKNLSSFGDPKPVQEPIL